MGNLREEIKDLVRRNSPDFNLEDGNSTETSLAYANRENGDMMNDECGDEDWEAGEKLVRELYKEFGTKINCNLEPCDEWVLLDIEIK